MKQARSALFFCLLVCLLGTAFVFGRSVRLSATAPLRQADAFASQNSRHNQWTEEALDTTAHNPSYPDTPALTNMAADDLGGGDDVDANDQFSADSPLVTFQSVYELLKEQYVDKIPSDTPLAHGAVAALIAALDDPNSRFLEAPERTDIENQQIGQYAGTGIVFTVRKVNVDGLLERQLTVIDPIAGSPADKAGIKSGDVITDINGHWVVSYDPFQAQAKLFKSLDSDPVSFNHAVDATESKIKDGYTLPAAQTLLDTIQTTPLLLSITRNGQPLQISVDGSSTTTVNDVTSKLLPDGDGDIQFNEFTNSTYADFEKAYDAVSSAPGIVIDLRNCPGGPINTALAIGQALAPNAPMGSIVVRDNHGILDKSVGFGVKAEPLSYTPDASSPVTPISYSGHFVVLVNGGTANTAELFAAFLHDQLGARIVGTPTFGDGLAQTLFPMPDGSAFTLTSGLVKTDTSFAFASKGIKPDDVIAQADASGDAALSAAEQALTLTPLKTSSAAPIVGGQKS